MSTRPTTTRETRAGLRRRSSPRPGQRPGWSRQCALGLVLAAVAVPALAAPRLAATLPAESRQAQEVAPSALPIDPERILDQYRHMLDQEVLSFSIAQAVEVAAAIHPEIQRRRAVLDQFPALRREALSDYLPQLDLTLQAAQTRDPGFRNSPFFSRLIDDPEAAGESPFGDAGPDPSSFGGAFTFGTYLWNFQLSQTLWSFRFRPALAGANIARDIAASELDEAKNRIGRDAAVRLYAYLLGVRSRDVLTSALETRERGLDLARDRLELGAGSRLDVLRAQLAVTRLRRQVADAEESLAVEQAGINSLVGRAQHLAIEVTDGLALPDPVPRVLPPEALMEIATLRRPQLHRFRLDRASFEIQAGLERADSLPRVEASASYGINTFTVENTYDLELHNWNAGVTLTWNLFDGFGTSSRIRNLRSQASQSEWEETEFESTLEVTLRAAAASWRGARAALEEAVLALEEATEAERVAREENAAGAVTPFILMEASQVRREVELEVARSTHDALAALAEMKFLVGFPANAPLSVISDPAPIGVGTSDGDSAGAESPNTESPSSENDR